MKIKISILILCVIAVIASCKKEIKPTIAYDSFTYSTTDDNGGTWNPIVLTSASQIAIPVPSDPTSAEYLTELSALKSMSASLTSDQKESVEYWSTNGVVRWNEIARELVAKYFLLPKPNDDGSYSWPSSTDPSAYPLYPFSSPPYSSRAFAYLSAGSFDAMIATWYYKFQYDRMAPSTYDASITTHLPVQSIPAYPSEDAVLAGFSRTMLTFLFPLEATYITEKSAEQQNSRMWAGLNVQSDLTAGDSLGTAIAKLFISRAKTDGMKNTLGNQAVWDSINHVWEATGKTIWKSLETPNRQMLAPKFGLVKPWNFTTADVTTTYRLPAPPEVGSAAFQTDLDEVLDYCKHATREEQEIALKWDDGTRTYTPPGHWNWIAEPYIINAQFNPLRAARVYAYMNMAIEDAGICVWDNKFHYFFPRPTNVNADIKTLMGVPNFPSYPSGHSGFSGAAATVLGHFFPSDASSFSSMANEAAMSRLYGCIHYRFDCTSGVTLGNQVGQAAINIAILDGGE